ncbi:hypothetical protein N6H05_07535 [Sphingobium sp. WTD-1]|uniref:hypothetical protein n=1 Tax=Sphingobium sp. WTD-1 TaxID=2979467 RepID=UPI0024DE164E|nr:hypothetical protein [Sphingobium sp. WTD-1]WIA57640.1 hypothetical protein N6H05_07535 [Sphingobium sp. WTD-1]
MILALHSAACGGSMKYIAAAVLTASLGLTGCASTNKVMGKEPKEVFHSTKSADEVAFCLANKNNTAPMPRDDGSRVVLIKNGYGAVSMAFSVYAEGTGSRIEYRKQFGTVGGAWKQCVGLKPEE